MKLMHPEIAYLSALLHLLDRACDEDIKEVVDGMLEAAHNPSRRARELYHVEAALARDEINPWLTDYARRQWSRLIPSTKPGDVYRSWDPSYFDGPELPLIAAASNSGHASGLDVDFRVTAHPGSGDSGDHCGVPAVVAPELATT